MGAVDFEVGFLQGVVVGALCVVGFDGAVGAGGVCEEDGGDLVVGWDGGQRGGDVL